MTEGGNDATLDGAPTESGCRANAGPTECSDLGYTESEFGDGFNKRKAVLIDDQFTDLDGGALGAEL